MYSLHQTHCLMLKGISLANPISLTTIGWSPGEFLAYSLAGFPDLKSQSSLAFLVVPCSFAASAPSLLLPLSLLSTFTGAATS